AWFIANTPPHVRLLPHGQKLSIAVVSGDAAAAAPLAARDISLFDQRGCLSIHDVYLAGG
ncbi:MAG: acyl-CoA reductase, partial [Akkermansiaceae bacterium]|nr:acyl-CoA reductase [Akkermansiaceae bacterium]